MHSAKKDYDELIAVLTKLANSSDLEEITAYVRTIDFNTDVLKIIENPVPTDKLKMFYKRVLLTINDSKLLDYYYADKQFPGVTVKAMSENYAFIIFKILKYLENGIIDDKSYVIKAINNEDMSPQEYIQKLMYGEYDEDSIIKINNTIISSISSISIEDIIELYW